VRTVHARPATGLYAGLGLSALGLLTLLGATVGLGLPGWIVGAGAAAGLAVALEGGKRVYGIERLGPADGVTLARAVLACGVAALTADSFGSPVPVPAAAPVAPLGALVTLAAVALVLDTVDGQVARRTRTASAFGARFDMESDAFLIAVLSVYVARREGVWVLALGAARYVFVAAGSLRPWLTGPLPARYWRKVVAAAQGIVLAVAAAAVLPDAATRAALVVALLLLVESFGRDVLTLWRAQRGTPAVPRPPAGVPGRHGIPNA